MSYHMFVSLLMNISLLTLVATLLTRVDPVKLLLFDRTGWWNANKLLLAALFGLISILSTYTGQSVDGAIFRERLSSLIDVPASNCFTVWIMNSSGYFIGI